MSVWKAESKEGAEARYIVIEEGSTNKEARGIARNVYNNHCKPFGLDTFAKSLKCVATISPVLAYKLKGNFTETSLKERLKGLKEDAEKEAKEINDMVTKLDLSEDNFSNKIHSDSL